MKPLTRHKNALLAFVICAFVAVCMLVGMSGCASNGTSSAPSSNDSDQVEFTDDLGRDVSVPKSPTRVVAGMGSFADMWQLAGGTLIGAPDEAFDDYGLDRSDVQSIGSFSSINQESILDMNPDFVILTGSTGGHAGSVDQTQMADTLSAAGVPVAYFNVTTFDDYLRVLQTLCQITGRDDLYQQNGVQVQDRINDAISTYGGAANGKRVLVGITYSQGMRVQRSSSMVGSMISDLGAINVADENPSLLKDFSTESLLDIDPDYVFVIPMGTSESAAQDALSAIASDPSFQSLSAVQNGRYHVLDPKLFVDKPNARWAEAYETLGQDFQN